MDYIVVIHHYNVVNKVNFQTKMNGFVLIYIDFQARGIDVQQVSLVINYDLPTNRENYIHRLVYHCATKPYLLFLSLHLK